MSDVSSVPDSDACSSLEDMLPSFTPRLADVLIRDSCESNTPTEIHQVQFQDQPKVSMPNKPNGKKENSLRAINKVC